VPETHDSSTLQKLPRNCAKRCDRSCANDRLPAERTQSVSLERLVDASLVKRMQARKLPDDLVLLHLVAANCTRLAGILHRNKAARKAAQVFNVRENDAVVAVVVDIAVVIDIVIIAQGVEKTLDVFARKRRKRIVACRRSWRPLHLSQQLRRNKHWNVAHGKGSGHCG